VEVTAVSGSSAGAIVGLFLAAGLKSDDMLAFLNSLEKKELFVWANGDVGLFKMEKVEKKLEETLGIKSFDELEIPFHVCVTNIATGESEYIDKGKYT
jgi:NTE family protein